GAYTPGHKRIHCPCFDEEAARVSGQPLRNYSIFSEPVLLLAGSNLSGYFGSKVDFSTLDTFAYFETHEGDDFGTGLLGQRTDLDFRIFDKRLLDQAGFSKELVDAALDHVLNDVFRLAGNLVGVQRQEDFLFLGNGFFGNLIRSDELRVAGRHVHGNFTRQLTVTTLEGHQHANAMAVQVGTDHVTFGASQATDVDVFTALGNQGFTSRLHVSDQRSSIAVSCA